MIHVHEFWQGSIGVRFQPVPGIGSGWTHKVIIMTDVRLVIAKDWFGGVTNPNPTGKSAKYYLEKHAAAISKIK